MRQQEQQTQRVAELRRWQAVRLYGSGMAVIQIMAIIGCAESSIRAWSQTYKRDGLAALRLHYNHSAHNASKLSPAQRADLQQRLHQYRLHQVLAAEGQVNPGAFWTVRALQIAIERWYGITYDDQGSYRALLHDCGFSYQRAERVYKSRPSQVDIADFETELEKVTDFRQTHPNGVIFALDQMSAYLQATLKRVWSPIGQTPYVWVTPQRACLHFFGALDVVTGQEVALALPTLDSDHTIHFLEHVAACFPQRSILLLCMGSGTLA